MSDVARLKRELETIYYVLLEELEEDRPDLDRRARREEAHTRLLAIVDDAVQDVTRQAL